MQCRASDAFRLCSTGRGGRRIRCGFANCPTAQVRDRITSLILDINLAYDTNLSELIVDQQTWDTGLPATLPIHAEIEEEGIRL